MVLIGLYSNPRFASGLPDPRAFSDDSDESTRIERLPRQVQKRLNKTEIEALVRARQDGAEIKDLAERFGVCKNTVTKHARGIQRADPVEGTLGR